jgi:16S rRNA (uracil1498-N3)-methyltransferase
MIRLFVSFPLLENKSIPLDDKQCHYLMHVMRCRPDDRVLLFNGKDGEWISILQTSGKKSIVAIPVEQVRQQTVNKSIVLCPALIKKENFDFVLQKATELGVTEIRPILTQRTVVRQLNRLRAEATVREAAEQCERLTVPTILDPVPLPQMLADWNEDTTLVYLSERGVTSASVPWDKPVAFIVGPEGGFTPDEIDMLANLKGSISCHLGDTILRAETASIAILSCYSFRIFS